MSKLIRTLGAWMAPLVDLSLSAYAHKRHVAAKGNCRLDKARWRLLTLALASAWLATSTPHAFAAATCFCKASWDDLSGTCHPEGFQVLLDLTSEVGMSYTGLRTESKAQDCARRCSATAAQASDRIIAAACAANITPGSTLRAFSAIGNCGSKGQYRSAQTIRSDWTCQATSQDSCPFPQNIVQFQNSGVPNPIADEIPLGLRSIPRASFNDSQVDRLFVHTMRWENLVPKGTCCALTKGTATVVLRDLGNALSNNDVVGIGLPGGAVGQEQALNFPPASGGIRTVNLSLTPAILASGHVTIFAQDDHSVQSISVKLTGCCLAEPVDFSNLNMQAGNETTPCPTLGITLTRADASTVPYLALLLSNLDQRCATKGAGHRLKSLVFRTCSPDPRGVGFGPNATADVSCEEP